MGGRAKLRMLQIQKFSRKRGITFPATSELDSCVYCMAYQIFFIRAVGKILETTFTIVGTALNTMAWYLGELQRLVPHT